MAITHGLGSTYLKAISELEQKIPNPDLKFRIFVQILSLRTPGYQM